MFKQQKGLSLVEVLVAVAILVIAFTVALVLYDAGRKSFKKGENATENTQSVRIAFDQMTDDLRMTGYNYNPDGTANRPDEQIEAAFDTAIVIRADFDGEDPVDSATPETALAGGQFLTVSTGNDEVVAFVLAKPDGSSPNNLVFAADVEEAKRDGDVEPVVIPNVALVQNDPPYTLYRVTLNNDESTYGTAGFATRTPLVENVRSMAFRYFDTTGAQINSTFDLTTTADDIGGGETAATQALRKSIRRIGIELEGMDEDPDLTWVDPSDTDPDTQRHRKFLLAGDVTPRNIGMVGVQDLMADTSPPAKPGAPTLIDGHCGALFVTWPANNVNDGVSYYKVFYGTAPGAYSGNRTAAGTSYYLAGLSDATTYYVAITAIDAAGNASPLSNETSTTTTNVNTPEQPQNVTATSSLNGAIDVSWDPVTDNTAALPAADPAAPRIRDLGGYRVYRNTNSSPANPKAVMIADESKLGASAVSVPDTNVINCKTYHYWVSAVDQCGVEGALSASASGQSTSSIAPAAPENLQAVFAGPNSVNLSWNAVTEDVNGDPIFIDSYRIYRSALLPAGTPPKPPFGYILHATISGATSYTDPTVFAPPGYTYYYTVQAVDDCPNVSAFADPVWPQCAFSGDVTIIDPAPNSPVAGVVPVTVEVTNGTDTYTQADFEFFHETNGRVEHSATVSGAGPMWTYKWLADPPGPYTVNVTVQNATGCSKTATIHVAAGFDVGCCLSPPNPDIDPVILTCDGNGANACKIVSYDVINNNCLTAVAIENMEVTWVDVVGNNPLLDSVLFDGTSIWNVVPQSTSPATNTFSDPKPSIDVSRDSVNPVVVTYVFTQIMSESVNNKGVVTYLQDTLTTNYDFRLLDASGNPTSITGSCGPKTGMFHNLLVERH